MDAQEGLMAGMGILGMIIGLAAIAFFIIVGWRIFTKAGKPGWAVIIPIYNMIVFLEIIGKPLWWIIMFIIPITTPIFGIWSTNLLAKSFGKEEGFTVGLILLPVIFYPILAFGSASYEGPAASEANNVQATASAGV